MAFKLYSPESSVVRDRPSVIRRFTANVAMSRVQGLLDIGMRLLVTARRFDHDSGTRANCLHGARSCQLRVEEDMWKFQEPSEIAQVTTGLERLTNEITILS
jgi:hypothetical protein